jgi:carbamoyl-phosphate synthase small subunit
MQEISGKVVVFNTGMFGYQKNIFKMFYQEKILCMTYPLIGNYAISEKYR